VTPSGDVKAGRQYAGCYNLSVPTVGKQEYSREQVLRLVGLTERQLRRWEEKGLVRPRSAYEFPDLIALQALARLRAKGVPLKKVQQAVSAIKEKMRDVEDPLRQLRVYAEGNRIRVQAGPHHMEPESGQLLLNFDEGELDRLVSFPREPADKRRREAARRRHREADNWFQKGLELEQTGGPIEQVMDAYRVAAALDPQMAAAHLNLGTIHFTMRQLDNAERYYRKAIEANPNYAMAHFNMGNLYDERGDRDAARKHYLAALRLDSDYADAHYNLALLYQATGQLLSAVRHWQAYLKLDRSGQWAEIARRELEKLYAATVVRGSGAKGAGAGK